MISISVIILLLVAHFYSDFMLQTDRQAKGKSSHSDILLEHVTTYGYGLFLPAFCIFSFNIIIAIQYVAVNMFLHFITDFISSRITSYLYRQGRTHEFFVVIGFDQLVHYICLLTTYLYFIK